MQKCEHNTAVIFRLSAMGDVALLTGVMRYFYEEYHMQFIIITREAFAPLFYRHPALLTLETFTNNDLANSKNYATKCKELAQTYKNYILLDMHASTRSRLLASYWQNKVFRYNKFPLYRRLFLWSHGFLGSQKLLKKNVCQRYASIFETKSNLNINIQILNNIPQNKFIPKIYLAQEETEEAKERLSLLFNKSRKKIIAIHPFATHESKSLDIEAWLTLAQKIQTHYQDTHDILWLGIGQLPKNFAGQSLVNQSSLRQLCALLSNCDLLITGDSGPMHLANAVNCAILALFGPTCEEWGFFPVGDKVRILQKDVSCRPCSLHGAKKCKKNKQCFSFTDDEILHTISQLLHV